ncbi:MAG: EamA family transporter [Paracoccaceae bacterium]|nr:EamA family transporter [Paracoccaceae bacterium]
MAYAIEGPPTTPSGRTLILVIFLGLIPTAGTNLLLVIVVRSAGPVCMTLTNYQVPMWSVILGILVLGEPIHARLLVALAFILCGVCLSQYGALKRLFGLA